LGAAAGAFFAGAFFFAAFLAMCLSHLWLGCLLTARF